MIAPEPSVVDFGMLARASAARQRAPELRLMKVLIQRVTRASVTVGGAVAGEIGAGLLLFVGVEKGDGEAQAIAAADKLASLRIFSDDAGKMNLDVRQVGGSALVVSQFTLAGSLARGRRPSFDAAAPPDVAKPLVERVARELASRGVPVAEGVFAADMAVELVNDGPVTFVLDI
jgi:D-tyrosyl-tRNA(Tyr) deacylase